MGTLPRSIDAIVESQVQRWLAERAKRPTPPAEVAPVITISREFGARGAEVARKVAERIGFSFWDRELLGAMARHAHLDPTAFEPFDEHHRSVVIGAVSGMIPRPNGATEADYARELAAVVREIVVRGGAVLVGRGIGFLIDPSRCLRVRIVCPLEQRIRGLAERERIPLDQARARIEFADRDRRQFVHDLYGREVSDPVAYDLWLNTWHMPIDGAADVIVAAYRARFGEPTVMRATATP